MIRAGLSYFKCAFEILFKRKLNAEARECGRIKAAEFSGRLEDEC